MPVTKTIDRTADVQKAIDALLHKRLLVGIIQSTNERQNEPIGNAALGYIFEVGSPRTNMPPRPWLGPGLRSAVPTITKAFRLAAKSALGGNIGMIDTYFEAAGQAGRDAAKNQIRSNIPPPIKPETVLRRKSGQAARLRRAIKAAGGAKAWRAMGGRAQYQHRLRMAQQEIDTGGVIALIDTSEFINSITYVVRSK